MGREDLTDIEQVALYIRDNYVDANGDDLTMAVAKAICQYEEMWEWIQDGVANRTFVYYIGDMIAERAKLDEIGEHDFSDNWENMEDPDDDGIAHGPFVTKTGRVLTDADVEALSEEDDVDEPAE